MRMGPAAPFALTLPDFLATLNANPGRRISAGTAFVSGAVTWRSENESRTSSARPRWTRSIISRRQVAPRFTGPRFHRRHRRAGEDVCESVRDGDDRFAHHNRICNTVLYDVIRYARNRWKTQRIEAADPDRIGCLNVTHTRQLRRRFLAMGAVHPFNSTRVSTSNFVPVGYRSANCYLRNKDG